MGWGKAVAAGPLRTSANRAQGAKKQRQQGLGHGETHWATKGGKMASSTINFTWQ